MNAWDQTKGQLLEEIRILRSRNAKLERINHEMPGSRDAQLYWFSVNWTNPLYG